MSTPESAGAGRGGLRAGRRLDAGLHLLDRQIVDADGRLAGKVDDLELVERDDGPPYVAAVLSGPGALSRRIGGRLGAWFESVQARLRTGNDATPAAISFGVVSRVDTDVHITISRDDLPSAGGEHWARDHVVAHIPGAAHAPE